MEKFREWIDQARVALARLTQREQLLVLGGGAAAVLIILIGIGAGVSHAIASEEYRVQVKTKMLSEVLALQTDYKARQAERAQRMQVLANSNVRLVSLVEDSARQAGVDIGQLRPEDADPNSDGIVESRVDLRASGLSADRLQDFLNHVERSPGVVIVRRLKVMRPYRKDVADLEMSVSTFKLKGPQG